VASKSIISEYIYNELNLPEITKAFYFKLRRDMFYLATFCEKCCIKIYDKRDYFRWEIVPNRMEMSLIYHLTLHTYLNVLVTH